MKKVISITITAITILILSLSLFLIDTSAAENTPAQYNSNIESPMYVTSIKNQKDYGICWAFSAISCCESEAIKNHGANKDTLDLSELHLAYFAYNAEKEDTGDKIITNAPFYEIGGDLTLPVFTLANWVGLVSEDIAPFESFLENPQIVLDKSLAQKSPEYYIKNAYIYDYATDIEQIKQAIMNFGAIQTGYFADDSFLNTQTSAYYCPHNYTMNHAISIIGWDDNYSRENFKSSYRPASDGAWLVKNSWGTSKGENGYFWLSYENVAIKQAIAYDVEPAQNFLANKNYQHDGGFSLVYYDYETIQAANIFTAQSSETLTSVGVFAHDAKSSPYTLKIYKNPQTLTPSAFNKSQPVFEQSGIIPYSGYSTIELTSQVFLNKGDTFIICIETSAILGFDSEQTISNGTQIISQSLTSVLPNQTYVAFNGSGFYDLGDPENGTSAANARIKAFTKELMIGDAKVIVSPSMNSIEYGQPLSASVLLGGKVIDSLTGDIINGIWSFKDVNSIVSANTPIEIVFTPLDQRYRPITKTINASVKQIHPTLKLSADKTVYKSGEPINLSVSVNNPHNTELSDVEKISYCYQIDDGYSINFTDPVFNIKNLIGKKLYITATVDEIEGKYLSASDTLIFSIENERITETESAQEVTDISTEASGGEGIDSDYTEINTDSIADKTPQEIIGNNTDSTEKVTSPDQSLSSDLNESDMESIKESVEESVKESVKDKVKDDILDSIGCGSSISISALFTAFALSAVTITKKRKR